MIDSIIYLKQKQYYRYHAIYNRLHKKLLNKFID